MPAFLTTSGLQKFAVATPENPVTVKYMAIGTGSGTVSENIQSLFNEVYRTEIPNPLRDEDNPRNLEFTGYIPTTVGGWTITELGLYDSSGVLVAYHLLDESIVKSSPDSALKTDMYPTFILALSNAEDVNLFVSDSVEFDHEALTGREKLDSHPIKAITGLQTALNQKTTDLNNSVSSINTTINTKDAQNVKLTGNQTVAGIKTFSNPIVTVGSNVTGVPIANVTGLQENLNQKTSDLNSAIGTLNTAINTKDAQNVKLSGNQAIKGNKSFEGLITSPDGKSNISLGNDGEITVNSQTGSVTAQLFFSVADGVFSVNGAKYRGDGSELDKASVSKAGVVQLNNTLTSASATEALTAGQGAILNGMMLGWGQAYQDVTASRVVGVTYTNSTTRPITAVITMRMSDDNLNANFIINSVMVGTMYGSQTSGTLDVSVVNTIVIPAGMTYSVSAGQLLKWTELR